MFVLPFCAFLRAFRSSPFYIYFYHPNSDPAPIQCPDPSIFYILKSHGGPTQKCTHDVISHEHHWPTNESIQLESNRNFATAKLKYARFVEILNLEKINGAFWTNHFEGPLQQKQKRNWENKHWNTFFLMRGLEKIADVKIWQKIIFRIYCTLDRSCSQN